MTPQQLKNSILQMAVQGKLVPQDKTDEPASILLECIKKEKEQLIKDKKIKKEKNPSVIFRKNNSYYEKIGKEERCIDDELPFRIPDSWEWARLGSILTKLTDGTHSTPKYTASGVPFISVKNMSSGIISFDNTKFISQEEHQSLFKRCDPANGDIILSKVGTTGIPVLVNTDIEFSLFVSVALLKFNHNFINAEFLVKIIQSPLVQLQCAKNTKGVGNKNWVMRDIANTLICIPPSNEQIRIVNKVNETIPYSENYNLTYSKLEKLNKDFPKQLKKSILDFAVQGKLVPQDKTDEPASILLERIKKEKEQLIKDKKIKKEKNPSVIFRKNNSYYERIGKEERCIDDELPFKIPDSWEWCRLKNIANLQTGTTPPTNKLEYFGEGMPFIKPADITENEICYNNESLTMLGTEKSRIIPKSSILMVCIGGSMGKSNLTNRTVCCNQQINAATPFIINGGYLNYVMNSEYLQLTMRNSSGGTATPIYNKTLWGELLIPLPPLGEQKLIVDKIDTLLNLKNKLQ